jgi:hypothetical protein
MESFRSMCNDAIRIGLTADASSLKRLSKLTYCELPRYEDVPSYYKLCAISKAAGILASRKKSIRHGFPTKDPVSRSLSLYRATGSRSRMARFSSLSATVSSRAYR